MRGNWIKNMVLMLGMTLSGAALLAQQATAPAPDTDNPERGQRNRSARLN